MDSQQVIGQLLGAGLAPAKHGQLLVLCDALHGQEVEGRDGGQNMLCSMQDNVKCARLHRGTRTAREIEKHSLQR